MRVVTVFFGDTLRRDSVRYGSVIPLNSIISRSGSDPDDRLLAVRPTEPLGTRDRVDEREDAVARRVDSITPFKSKIIQEYYFYLIYN